MSSQSYLRSVSLTGGDEQLVMFYGGGGTYMEAFVCVGEEWLPVRAYDDSMIVMVGDRVKWKMMNGEKYSGEVVEMDGDGVATVNCEFGTWVKLVL